MQAAKQTHTAKVNDKQQKLKELRVETRLAIIGVALTAIYACLCVTYMAWYTIVCIVKGETETNRYLGYDEDWQSYVYVWGSDIMTCCNPYFLIAFR